MSRCWKPPRPASLLVLGLANANTNLGSYPSLLNLNYPPLERFIPSNDHQFQMQLPD